MVLILARPSCASAGSNVAATPSSATASSIRAKRISPPISVRLSKPIARPDRARFQRRNQFVRKAWLAEQRADPSAKPRRRPPEPAGFGRYQRRLDRLAIAFAQGRAQITDAVEEPKFQASLRSP